MKYNIGDKVWVSEFKAMDTKYVTCPDCGGYGHIKVTLYDEDMVFIECSTCQKGYNPSTGKVEIYVRTVKAKEIIITGMIIRPDKTEYHSGTNFSYDIYDEENVFSNEQDALDKGNIDCANWNKEQEIRALRKENDKKSWGWNASYHRRNIKELEEKIIYHKSKLNVASLKAKEDKKNA